MNTTTATDVTREKLVADVKLLMSDTEELLRATASQAGEKVTAARERLQASLSSAKTKVVDAERIVVDKTKQAAHVTDAYVHEHPWQAVGIAAGIGFLLGMLVSRR